VTAADINSPLTGIPIVFDVKKGFLTDFGGVFDMQNGLFDTIFAGF
jgi:hypothetical protein